MRGLIQNLVDNGQLKEGELDSYELKSLSCFDTSSGLEILALFTEGGLKKIGNKSGKFLFLLFLLLYLFFPKCY